MRVKNVLIVAAILLFLFWNPVTRMVIVTILPLGSGVDDLVFLALAVAVSIYGLAYYAMKRKER